MMRLTMLLSVSALLAAPVAADEAADMADLSKRAFMAEYEASFVASIAVQRELFMRFDPDLAEDAILDGPVSEAELAAMECTYDALAASNGLEGLARQVLLARTMEQMAEDNPSMDIVDLFMNKDMLLAEVDDIPSEVLSAMSDCGSISASKERLNFTPDVWQAVGAAGEARGYTQ